MQQDSFEITSRRDLAANIYEMKLRGDTGAITAPGQFVQLSLPGFFLRRPLSVCDVEGDSLTLVYNIAGKGTSAMAKLAVGTKLDLLTGLGRGFDLGRSGEKPLLIGGGMGVPPLYLLAKRLRQADKEVNVILGFDTAAEAFYEEEFRTLGCSVRVTTADGSRGKRGFVTAALPDSYSYVYSCGPEEMLRAVFRVTHTSGQYSLEERMGCGFGACMGCTREMKGRSVRICTDGPVFEKEELPW